MTTSLTATAKELKPSAPKPAVTAVRKRPLRSERLSFRVTEEELESIFARLGIPRRSQQLNDKSVKMLFRQPVLSRRTTESIVESSLPIAKLGKALSGSRVPHTHRPPARTKTVSLRVTEEEREALQAVAEAHSLPFYSYVRRQLLGVDVREIQHDDAATHAGLEARAEAMKKLYP